MVHGYDCDGTIVTLNTSYVVVLVTIAIKNCHSCFHGFYLKHKNERKQSTQKTVPEETKNS